MKFLLKYFYYIISATLFSLFYLYLQLLYFFPKLSYVNSIYEDGSEDVFRLVDLANRILALDFYYIPHWYSKSLPFLISGITDILEASYYNIFLYNFMNIISLYFVLSCIKSHYLRKLIPKSTLNLFNILFIVIPLCPGFVFSVTTFRSEWISYFAILFGLKILNGENLSTIQKFLTITFRPSALLFVIFIYLHKKLFIKREDFSIFMIYNNAIIFSILLLFTLFTAFEYAESAQYSFIYYNDAYRDFFNISRISELWLIYVKPFASLLLESFGILFNDEPFDLQSLNSYQGIIRIVIIIYLFILFTVNGDGMGLLVRRCVGGFIIFTVFNTVVIGFYQTRYIIPADLFLYLALLLSTANRKTSF